MKSHAEKLIDKKAESVASQVLRNPESVVRIATRKTQKEMDSAFSETRDGLKSARIQMEESLDEIIKVYDNLVISKKMITDDIRALRMTVVTEVSSIIKPLEEVRKFYLSEKHQEEVVRLKEFVEICERLQKLKASGFLDTVADTMIKLT